MVRSFSATLLPFLWGIRTPTSLYGYFVWSFELPKAFLFLDHAFTFKIYIK
jgi:hypothetical protein